MAEDLLIKTIQTLVPSEWKNSYEPVYFLYDRNIPHNCGQEYSYMGVDKQLRWTCKHENLCRTRV